MKCSCEHTNCLRHLNNAGHCDECIEKNLLAHEIPNCFYNDAELNNNRKDDKYETFASLYKEKYGKENN